MAGGNHLAAGESGCVDNLVKGHLREIRQKKKQATKMWPLSLILLEFQDDMILVAVIYDDQMDEQQLAETLKNKSFLKDSIDSILQRQDIFMRELEIME